MMYLLLLNMPILDEFQPQTGFLNIVLKISNSISWHILEFSASISCGLAGSKPAWLDKSRTPCYRGAVSLNTFSLELGEGWRLNHDYPIKLIIVVKLISVGLLLLYFHTTDKVYLVQTTGIRTCNPWISTTATLHLSTRLKRIGNYLAEVVITDGGIFSNLVGNLYLL